MESGRRSDTKPFLPLYVDDWFACARVRVMSLAQRGAYLELLMMQWRDGQIPAPEHVKRLFAELTSSELGELLEAFPNGRNERLERERAIAEQITSTRRSAGKLGAKARWQTHGKANAIALPPDGDGMAHDGNAQAQAQAQAQAHQKKPRAQRSGHHAELIRTWEQLWLDRRGTPYAVEAKDGAAMAACLKLAGGDPKLVVERMTALLDSPDAWLVQNASIPMLRSRWNQLAVTVVPKPRTSVQAMLDGLEAANQGLLLQ